MVVETVVVAVETVVVAAAVQTMVDFPLVFLRGSTCFLFFVTQLNPVISSPRPTPAVTAAE